MTDHLLWSRRPDLDRPVIITAFSGWNDAGDAATWAVRHLHNRLVAEPFADIDGEEFYDFTDTRPTVELDGDERVLHWPRNELSFVSQANLVLVNGVEPQLKWRTFGEQIISVARELDASMVVSLGALLADVPHTRPVTVYGSCEDAELGRRLGLERSSYEGPTGIVGVINSLTQAAGIATASLWAAVPNYVAGAPSPKAALALVVRLQELLGVTIPVTDLEIATAAYERQINDLVAEDDDLVQFIGELEQHHDEAGDAPDPTAFVEEVEQFLREQD